MGPGNQAEPMSNWIFSRRELGPCRCPQESSTSSGMLLSLILALLGSSVRALDEEQHQLPWQHKMFSSGPGQYLAKLSPVAPPPVSHPCSPQGSSQVSAVPAGIQSWPRDTHPMSDGLGSSRCPTADLAGPPAPTPLGWLRTQEGAGDSQWHLHT